MKKTTSLIIVCLLLSAVLFSFIAPLHGQVYESKTVYIDLSGKMDIAPPQITVHDPSFPENGSLLSTIDHLDIVLEVSDASKISFIKVNRDVKLQNESGIYSSTAWFTPGENRIEIKSADDHGNETILEYWVTYQPPVVSLEDRIMEQSDYYGLIIGINEYQDERIPDLSNPIADALSVYECLVSNYTFERENMTLLKDPTRREIIDEMDNLRTKVGPDDNVVIFYAGHGYFNEKDGTGYWLPSDATNSSTADWFRNSTLVDYIKSIDSKHTLLITDACFAGSIFETRRLSLVDEMAYDIIYDKRSRKAMTSGAKTEVPDKSAFVKYLLESLKENQSTYLSSEDLFYGFKKTVISSSPPGIIPQYGEIRSDKNEGGDFIFLKRRD